MVVIAAFSPAPGRSTQLNGGGRLPGQWDSELWLHSLNAPFDWQLAGKRAISSAVPLSAAHLVPFAF